jgi:SAM-dependent methyltransferase
MTMTSHQAPDPSPAHWDEVYRTRSVTDVSWFQSEPTMSLRLLHGVTPGPRSVIDVGGGASELVDALLAEGIDDLTVLDASKVALDLVRQRLGDTSGTVSFVVGDVRAWVPERQWDAWHDRAVFHFLVDATDQDRYAAVAAAAVPRGGVVVLGSFALDGPEQCSGLPTARHGVEDLAELFGPAFTLERAEREIHRTPAGADQAFTWVVLRRT